MEDIKVIKSDTQYYEYCNRLEQLESLDSGDEKILDQIELLHLLIEKYDDEIFELPDLDPVEYLKMLMSSNNLKRRDIQKGTGIDKTTLSHMLNYRRGFSKNNIRLLARYFKVTQDTFNKEYELKNARVTKQKTKVMAKVLSVSKDAKDKKITIG